MASTTNKITPLLDKTLVKFSNPAKPNKKITAIITESELAYLDSLRNAHNCSYSDILRALIIEAIDRKLE